MLLHVTQVLVAVAALRTPETSLRAVRAASLLLLLRRSSFGVPIAERVGVARRMRYGVPVTGLVALRRGGLKGEMLLQRHRAEVVGVLLLLLLIL